MTLSSLYRVIIFAWQSFWRNIWLSLVTITIIVLTFVSINFLIVVNIITDSAIEIVKNKVDVSLYFRPDVTEPQVLEVKTYLSSLTQVREIGYVSQQQALENFRQQHRQDTNIIESLAELEENPIGATLQVKAKNIQDYPEIIDVLNNSKYNNLILDKNYDDHKVYIEKIKNFSDNIKTIGLFTSGTFALIALLIVFNTIRVAIYTHRQEIAIMKLVGATNWFIKAPFLVEAIFYGVISCIISIAVVYPAIGLIQPYVNNFFLTEEFNITGYFNENFFLIFGLEILVIIFLNIVSSSIAMRRYLKV
ncbi:MAG: ABC transporter permease [Candidatus Buchananbacteria bacterium]|nr:ABC transporter permease [Candidatus Buchananbacteria bacterium]